jgi:hypothetical protein
MIELIQRHWPTLFRGWLYFTLAALPVFLSEVNDYTADGVKPPNAFKLMWIFGSALVAGLVAIRAFYDGSVQRNADALAEKDRTDFKRDFPNTPEPVAIKPAGMNDIPR